MSFLRYQGLHSDKGQKSRVEDALILEEALNIRVNKEIFTVTMQTPGHEIDLVRGLLFAEGIVDADLVPEVQILERNKLGNATLVNAEVPAFDASELINKRSLLSAAACGICGSRELEIPEGKSIDSNEQFDLSGLSEMFDLMSSYQTAFEATGGCHAAAMFNQSGELLSIREDVGRHNAVDKVVGDLIASSQLNEAKILLVSGRVSYEIISKAFRARTPIIAAVSAPSSLSVDFAKEFGITLVAFARGDRFTIYSHPERIR